MEWKAAAVFILLVMVSVILANYAMGPISSFVSSVSGSSQGA